MQEHLFEKEKEETERGRNMITINPSEEMMLGQPTPIEMKATAKISPLSLTTLTGQKEEDLGLDLDFDEGEEEEEDLDFKEEEDEAEKEMEEKEEEGTEVMREKEEEEDKVEEESDEEVGSDDPCSCVRDKDCTPDRMDFTFGKSCSFGFVRCCPLEDTSEKEEDEVLLEETVITVVQEEEEEEKEGHHDNQDDSRVVGLPYQIVPSQDQDVTCLLYTSPSPRD